MGSSYEVLISKINEFTRKFYLNKLLRGLIYTFAVLAATYLFSFVLVYYLHPSPLLKTILFFSSLLLVFVLMAISVIKPALAYFRLSKTLTLEESAAMIGEHFSPVRDKLLNTLQLKALADLSPHQNQLILAGIDQKIDELKFIPFSTAIRLTDNKKYVKYFLFPAAVIIAVGMLAPAILREGTYSFVQYDQEILPPAPFRFVVLNKGLTVTQGDDLKLELKLEGDELPQEVYIREGLNTYKLEQENHTKFHYTFKNLQKTAVFYLSAGGFDSKAYPLTVIPRPAILNISAILTYPAYLKKKDETISNAGDLILPEGTVVNWKVFTENTKEVIFKVGKQVKTLKLIDNAAVLTYRVKESQRYRVAPKNIFSAQADTIGHRIEVIADQFPLINVTEKGDSLSSKAIYFTGTITDDHGFNQLRFVYSIKKDDGTAKKYSTAIRIDADRQQNTFFYFWNLKDIDALAGQQIDYYLEVTDNDGINGPKTTRSNIRSLSKTTPDQVARQRNASSADLKQKMGSAIKLAEQVAKESKKLGQDFLDKKALSFEDKKEIGQLLEKQKKLEDAVKMIQDAKKKNSAELEEDNELKQDLAAKQKKIDELFNQVLDPKTKALLEKLQGMMQQNNKDQVQKDLSKMSMDNKSLKNELDRILELYKQLEFEQQLQDKISRINDLAKAQKELGKKAADKHTPLDQLKKEQEKQIEEFAGIQKEIKQLQQKNEELEHPNSFSPPQKEIQSVVNQQQKSLDKLNKNQPQQAGEIQQETAKQLEKIADSMQEQQQESAEMENNLNSAELRRLLQNLLQSSFDQEKLMLGLKKIAIVDPQYNSQVQQQKQIKDNMKTIADSLGILSKKVPQIESTVLEEMQQINFNLDKSLEHLVERRQSEAAKNQHFTMTSINNLALMLNEALDQLEKNKKNSKNGGKGKSKGSMQQLQQMQEKLNKNMQQAKDQLQKQGNKGSVPDGMMSEEFAKMAQQQQMIREALQKINQEDNKDGKGSMGNLNQAIQDMKATETDLLNKKIEVETIKRQQLLMTKLLDAQNALREQDEDSKRESKAARDFPPSYQQQLQEFKKKQVAEQELLQKLPPSLNYYYKNKITDYFKLLNLPK
jgi:hypothetical protein